jgi:hypothetical protein
VSFTYSGDPSLSDKDAVRFEIADTIPSAPLLQDAEVEWAILSEAGQPAGTPTTLPAGDIYRSAARCMETLSRLFAAQADTQIGQLKTAYSAQAKAYAQRAGELRAKAQGLNAPYAGGVSRSDDQRWRQNIDLVRPAFTRDEFDSPYTRRGANVGGGLGPPFQQP